LIIYLRREAEVTKKKIFFHLKFSCLFERAQPGFIIR